LSYWSPRFEPYLKRSVEAFRPPPGALVVAGCGPGDEVLMLCHRFPDRSVLAADLSPAMVRLARQRVREAGFSNVLVVEEDAARLSGRIRQAAGVLSCFTLQLLPDPLQALSDWSRLTRHEGSLTVLFWPQLEDSSPFSRLERLLRERAGYHRQDWEKPALEALPRLGLNLLADGRIEHEMAHGSPEEYWRELHESGPLQVVQRRLGKELVDAIGTEWLQAHGFERRGENWVHRPVARLWVLERIEKV